MDPSLTNSVEVRSGVPHTAPNRSGRQIAVIGAGGAPPDSESWRLAEEVGRRLAEAGVVVVCGGRGGVMAAVSRGAASAGGEVIGIVPGTDPGDANRDCTHVVATGVGHARNLAVVGSGEVVIAIGGEWGTLSEIGHARTLGRTVVALCSWILVGRDRMEGAPGVIAVETAEEAVAAALAEL
ncbi:MAG TPA: TIGR00725 family protein [Solirubrobacterales bacterium]|nr:TIGR00725 family protein [Solirubrobacterales bacterium]